MLPFFSLQCCINRYSWFKTISIVEQMKSAANVAGMQKQCSGVMKSTTHQKGCVDIKGSVCGPKTLWRLLEKKWNALTAAVSCCLRELQLWVSQSEFKAKQVLLVQSFGIAFANSFEMKLMRREVSYRKAWNLTFILKNSHSTSTAIVSVRNLIHDLPHSFWLSAVMTRTLNSLKRKQSLHIRFVSEERLSAWTFQSEWKTTRRLVYMRFTLYFIYVYRSINLLCVLL